MKRVYALINPQLLKWSRERSGMSFEFVSKKVKIKVEVLQSFESGETKPSIPQLRKLGKLFKRPIAIFYLSEPPKAFDPIKDFRVVFGKADIQQSIELLQEIRRAHERRFIALELSELLDLKPRKNLDLRLDIHNDPETCGSKIRKWFGLSDSSHPQWGSDYQAFNEWRNLIESKSILVFQAAGIDVKEMRGFSITKFPLPVVVVNSRDAVYGRIFSLLHELAHILLNDGGICDFDEAHSHAHSKVEVFCNAVAGATILPTNILNSSNILNTVMRNKVLSEEALLKISREFSVSGEVILRRLLDLGRISQSTYSTARTLLLRKYAEYAAKKRSGFVPQDLKALARAGKTYTRLVLNSFDDNRISSSEVSDFLGVRVKHLEGIRERLDGGYGEL